MNYRLKLLPLLVAFLGLLAVPLSNWCIDTSNTCRTSLISSAFFPIIQPLYFFFLTTIIIGAILPFVSDAVFKTWWQFAKLALALCVIFMLVTPVSSTSFGPDFFPYYRVNAAHDAGLAFTVLSILVIAWKYWRIRTLRNSVRG